MQFELQKLKRCSRVPKIWVSMWPQDIGEVVAVFEDAGILNTEAFILQRRWGFPKIAIRGYFRNMLPFGLKG